MNTPDFRNYKNAEIDKTIDAAMTSLRTITGNSMDLNIMNVKICSVSCALVSIEGMISTSAMSELIFRPIMELSARKSKGNAEQVFDFLTKESLLAAERKTVFNYGDVIQFLFSGFAVIFVEGLSKAVVYGIQGYDKRSVSEPASEQTIMCAQDSFTETIRTNISLVRRRLKTPSLRFEMMQIGKRSSTDVCMVYMSDRASSDAVDRLRKQLKGIKLDTVLTSGYIEPFIDEGFGSSVFSQMAYSERPDMICTRLNQGRICVFVDGTPFVLICPSLFAENFQTMDDFTEKPFYVTFMRWLKYIAFFLAVAFPGLYVALASFHPEVFTLKLLLNLAVSEESTPYPLTVEVLVLMLLFEIMKEAGLRLPKPVGSTVSIVGGLIIGGRRCRKKRTCVRPSAYSGGDNHNIIVRYTEPLSADGYIKASVYPGGRRLGALWHCTLHCAFDDKYKLHGRPCSILHRSCYAIFLKGYKGRYFKAELSVI